MRKVSTHFLAALLALVALGLSACGSALMSSNSILLLDIYTPVAQTVSVQSTYGLSTAALGATSAPLATSVPPVSSSANSTPTHSAYVYPYANGCDNAAYVSDLTVADGTEFAPGDSFTKTWQLLNTGRCTWSTGYAITFVSGDNMDGADTVINQSVAPGQYAQISVSLTAPEAAGTYTGYWIMANESGSVFGEQVYAQIVVFTDAAGTTPTDTPSPTPAATAVADTSTLTSTPAADTSTATPTSIPPTATETETSTGTVTPPAATDSPTSTPVATPTSAREISPADHPNA